MLIPRCLVRYLQPLARASPHHVVKDASGPILSPRHRASYIPAPTDSLIGTPRRLAAKVARTGRRSRTRTHDDRLIDAQAHRPAEHPHPGLRAHGHEPGEFLCQSPDFTLSHSRLSTFCATAVISPCKRGNAGPSDAPACTDLSTSAPIVVSNCA
jgi:hypothetical protein